MSAIVPGAGQQVLAGVANVGVKLNGKFLLRGDFDGKWLFSLHKLRAPFFQSFNVCAKGELVERNFVRREKFNVHRVRTCLRRAADNIRAINEQHA